VVDTSISSGLVRFLRGTENGVEAAYDVLFSPSEKPVLSVPADRKLTVRQQASARALLTARKVMMEGSRPWCGGVPNTVVLPAPNGSGILVYFLRPKESNDMVPVGGHYRVSVSADGSTVERVDQLFASCLTVNRNDVPKDGSIVGLSMSHIVS